MSPPSPLILSEEAAELYNVQWTAIKECIQYYCTLGYNGVRTTE